MQQQDKPAEEIQAQQGSASPELSDPLVGTRIDSRFQIISLLGRGGYGRVYKAQHLLLEQLVALKILDAHLLESENAQQRLRNEGSALSELSHPNIVKFLAFGITGDGSPYLVTEFLAGQTLAEVLKQKQALTAEEAIPLFKEICQGLEAAHQKGFVHRDIKPGNIMISQDGDKRSVKLVDFGITFTDGSKNQKLTATGHLIGSSNYMSPEQCTAERDLDARSDIYSLGCLMYECMTGLPPMHAETDLLVMHKQLNKVVSKVPAVHGISMDFEKIILRCLEKDRRKRFASAIELMEQLEHARVDPDSRKRSKPKKDILLLAGFIFLLIVAAGLTIQKIVQNKTDREIKSFARKRVQLPDLGTAPLPEIEKWISDHANDAELSPLLVDAFVRAQEIHCLDSIPGTAPEPAAIKQGLEKLLRQHSGDRIKIMEKLALLQAAVGNKEGLLDTVIKLDKKYGDTHEWDKHRTAMAIAQICELRSDYTTAIGYALKAAITIAPLDSSQYLFARERAIQCSIANRNYEASEELIRQKIPAASVLAQETLKELSKIAKEDRAIGVALLPDAFTALEPFCAPREILKCEIAYFGPSLDSIHEKRATELREWEERSHDPAVAAKTLLRLKIRLARAYRLVGDRARAKGILSSLDDKLMELFQRKFKEEFGPDMLMNELVHEYARLGDETHLMQLFQKAKSAMPAKNYLKAISAALDTKHRIPALNFLYKLAPEELAKYGDANFFQTAHIKQRLGQFELNEGKNASAYALFKSAWESIKGSGASIDEKMEVGNASLRVALKTEQLAEAKELIEVLNNANWLNQCSSANRFSLNTAIAWYLYLTGKPKEGQKSLQKIWEEFKKTSIRNIPTFATATRYLAQTLEDDKKYDEAENYLREGFDHLMRYRYQDPIELESLLKSVKECVAKNPNDENDAATSEWIQLQEARLKELRKIYRFDKEG